MAYASVGRKRIYYETRGNGEPLLLLMGWQGDRTWWPESLLLRLEKSFLLILMDHRGTGLSTDPLGVYSIKSLAKDATLVLDDLNLPSASLLSVSMGGMVAQAMAIYYADRVDKLILTSSSAKVGLFRGLNKEQKNAWISYLRRRDRRLDEFILDLLFSKDCKNDDSPAIKEFLNQTNQQRTPVRTVIQQFLAIQLFDSRKKLQGLSIPTLVVSGDDDMIIGVHHSEALCRFISNSQLHLIQGGSHAMLGSAAEELARVYMAFLNK